MLNILLRKLLIDKKTRKNFLKDNIYIILLLYNILLKIFDLNIILTDNIILIKIIKFEDKLICKRIFKHAFYLKYDDKCKTMQIKIGI